jgi:hypothetical protein
MTVCPVKRSGATNSNVAKIPYRRVGCAHQIALNRTVEGGHSPPYTKNTGNNQG